MYQNNTPLVSIIVITYNSSKFVLETLESAKAQTYPNIELIVSDDCSTDDTINICATWMEKNKDRFIRTQLLTTASNTGIAANCNRGISSADGTWAKLIAGDDALFSNCLTENVNYVLNNNNSYFIFSDCQLISNEIDDFMIDYVTNARDIYNKPSAYQYDYLILKGCFPSAPTSFINLDILINKLNGFDEDIPMIEDYPLWLKATKSGYSLKYFPTSTVLYRQHAGNILKNSHINIVNSRRLFYKYRFKSMINADLLLCIDNMIYYETMTKKNPFFNFIRKLSPLYILSWCKQVCISCKL